MNPIPSSQSLSEKKRHTQLDPVCRRARVFLVGREHEMNENERCEDCGHLPWTDEREATLGWTEETDLCHCETEE